MKFNKNCIKSVKHVLDSSDIYSIDNFSYKLAQYEVGFNDIAETRDIFFILRKNYFPYPVPNKNSWCCFRVSCS